MTDFAAGVIVGAVWTVALLACGVSWMRERAAWRRLGPLGCSGGPTLSGPVPDLPKRRPRPRGLPVLQRCGDCGWCGPTSGGWSCDHLTSVARVQQSHGLRECPQGPHVEHDSEPPSWCPLRGGA